MAHRFFAAGKANRFHTGSVNAPERKPRRKARGGRYLTANAAVITDEGPKEVAVTSAYNRMGILRRAFNRVKSALKRG